MSERGRTRLGITLLFAGLAVAGADLGWRLTADPAAGAAEGAAQQAQARNREAMAALARALEPRVQQASRLPELVAALDTQVDDKTLQDIVDTEESWAELRRAFPLQAVISGDRTLARTGPPGFERARAALVETARARGVTTAFLAGDEAAYLAGAASITDAKRVIAERPVLVLGEPLDGKRLEGIAQTTGDAVGLSNGRRLLASAGPLALRQLLPALTGREAQPAPAGTAAIAVAPDLWLWVAFAAPAAAASSSAALSWLVAGLFGALGLGLLLLGRRGRPADADPAALTIHRLPTQIGLQDPSPSAPSAPVARPPSEAPAHATPALAMAALPGAAPPTEMGRYRLLKPIGEGGMAEVYIAEAHGPEGFKRHFVVKRMHPHLATRKEVVTQFIDEARLQARLLHSNIVPVFDFGRAGEEYFLALEYVHGRDLEKLTHKQIQATGRGLPAPIVFFVMHEVLEALAYAHDRTSPSGEPLGIVHRDVSPANVLLSYLGEVKLSDFGIVKAAGRVSKTDERVVKGNVSFMSPEQARGEAAVDARSDLFSAGAVMFYCLTGRTLYSGETTINQLVRAAVGPVTEQFRRLADLPAEAGPILNKALALDPAQRFQTASEFAQALSVLTIASKADLARLMRSYYAEEMKRDF